MIHLKDRGVVRVGGAEAGAFLQGLVTNDMLGLRPGSARYAALLSPQGKILFDFLVFFAGEDGFFLDCAKEQAAGLASRLGFYRLRAKIAIADLSAELGIGVSIDDPGLKRSYRDPREKSLGWRAILPPAEMGEGDDGAWDARRIALGVPRGGVDFAYGETFAHEANLDRLHGIDFRKGCYVGQEVVSRVEHRGLARKRIVQVTYAGAAPAAGSAVTAGDALLGVMGSSAQGRGLAMLRLDRLATGAPAMAGDVAVQVAERQD